MFNLAGEPVSEGRWTDEKKRRIRDSRVVGTRDLVAGLALLKSRPRVLVSASAVGYYGDRGDEELDERSAAGHGFLAEVCADWEREAMAASQLGIRVVCVRIGIVLAPGGGALARMLTPFRMGVGGRLGSGRQWMPWIHIKDVAGIMLHASWNNEINGPMNAVAPSPVTNADFTRALAHAVHRPAAGRAAPCLRRVERHSDRLAASLSESGRAHRLRLRVYRPPRRARRCDDRDSAVLRCVSDYMSKVYRLEQSQFIPKSREEVFTFFADASNLERITPAFLHFHILTPRPIPMQPGALIDYQLRLCGVPFRWKTRIETFEPVSYFTDIQLSGPYRRWHHRHEFAAVPGGTEMKDIVDYELPLGPLGVAARWLFVRSALDRINYRRAAITEIFGHRPSRFGPFLPHV